MHRAHSARAVAAHLLSQRSLSPPHSSPERRHASTSSFIVPDSRGAASTAERPLPEQTHRSPLKATAADPRHTAARAASGKPQVKRKLLNGMNKGSTSTQPAADNNTACFDQVGNAAVGHAASLGPLPEHPESVDTAPQLGIQADAYPAVPRVPAAVPAADASQHTALISENGDSALEQRQQTGSQAQMSEGPPQQAGPVSAKAFLNGMHAKLPSWGDVDPSLAKDHAALNR